MASSGFFGMNDFSFHFLLEFPNKPVPPLLQIQRVRSCILSSVKELGFLFFKCVLKRSLRSRLPTAFRQPPKSVSWMSSWDTPWPSPGVILGSWPPLRSPATLPSCIPPVPRLVLALDLHTSCSLCQAHPPPGLFSVKLTCTQKPSLDISLKHSLHGT